MFQVVDRLSFEQQVEFVELCRELVRQSPLFRKHMPNGSEFRYLCTSAGQYGWFSDQDGYRYVEHHPLSDQPFPAIPQPILDVAKSVAISEYPAYQPQSCLINWYKPGDSLGLHQDRTEHNRKAPVVSVSLGDDCEFLIGGNKYQDETESLILYSGDVLLMSGQDRMRYHSMKRVIPNTQPAGLLKQPGRINLTLRQVY